MQHPTNHTITTNLPDHGPQGIHNFRRPCQLRFINDPSRKRIVEESRQIGLSLNTAYDLLSKPSPARSSCNTCVSSRHGFQAQLLDHVASDISPITSSSAVPPDPSALPVRHSFSGGGSLLPYALASESARAHFAGVTHTNNETKGLP
jgi:hypothetical protein